MEIREMKFTRKDIDKLTSEIIQTTFDENGYIVEVDMSAELEKDNVANEKKANIVWECNEFCNCQNCKEVA